MKNLFRAARSAVKTASAAANSDDVRFFAGPAIMTAEGVLGSIYREQLVNLLTEPVFGIAATALTGATFVGGCALAFPAMDRMQKRWNDQRTRGKEATAKEGRQLKLKRGAFLHVPPTVSWGR
jgi:hypothetical protein